MDEGDGSIDSRGQNLFVIDHSPALGRRLQAARNIRQGEVITKELPLGKKTKGKPGYYSRVAYLSGTWKSISEICCWESSFLVKWKT